MNCVNTFNVSFNLNRSRSVINPILESVLSVLSNFFAKHIFWAAEDHIAQFDYKSHFPLFMHQNPVSFIILNIHSFNEDLCCILSG